MPTKYTLEQLFVIVDRTNTHIMYSDATVITLDEHMFSLMAQCTIEGREMVMDELELH
jgi:hypothetical protein